MTVTTTTTFVLIHGSCHGGWCWKKLTPLIRKHNSKVYVPTLTGLGERSHLLWEDIDLDTHIQDVIQVFEYEDLQEVTLVGHSYGGLVIGGVARKYQTELRPWFILMHIYLKMAKVALI